MGCRISRTADTAVGTEEESTSRADGAAQRSTVTPGGPPNARRVPPVFRANETPPTASAGDPERAAAYAAPEDDPEAEGRRTPNPLQRPAGQGTPSIPGSARSELDLSTVEVDIGEKTPPLTLVAIVTAFAHDLAVQRQALRYLALNAYEAQGELGRPDVAAQLVRTLQRALDAFREAQDQGDEHRAIDIAGLLGRNSPPPADPPAPPPPEPAVAAHNGGHPPQFPPPWPPPPTGPHRGGRPAAEATLAADPPAAAAADGDGAAAPTPSSSAPGSCRSSWAVLSGGSERGLKGAQELRIDVTCYALQVLAGVAQHSAPNQTVLTEHGVFAVTFEAMRLHQYTTEVLNHGLRLLSTLTVPPEGRREFVARRGVSILLELVESNACDAQLQQSGCRMLAHLVGSNDPAILQEMHWARVAQALHRARVSHPQHPTIASLATQAHIASLHGIHHALRKGLLVPGPGDVQALCLTLDIAPGNSGLHNHMLSLLLEICGSEAAGDPAAAARMVATAQTVDACVAALTHDAATVASCATATRLVGALSAHEAHRELLLERRAPQAVLEALRFFPGSAVLAEHALGALRPLLVSQKGREVFTEEAGIDRALDAMRAHLGSEGVQREGAECLRCMCQVEAAARTCVLEADGAAVLAASVRAQPGVRPTAALLCTLASSERHRRGLVSCVPTLVQCLAQVVELAGADGAAAPDLPQHQALLRLLSLLTIERAAADLVAEHGGVRPIVDVMWLWKANAGVACAGTPTLRNLAGHSACARQLRHHTAVPLLEHIAKRHPAAEADATAAIDLLNSPI
eukprot:TRINITY_DN23973_c0_g1_i1.p1 TRINITY_DN23973_c0_g1~~TRINITY_DN23973_c0_g1_i1.p1  ORF type:complete len:804 (+),score=207.41 TRINITY_DN23973_c0_g1_i1:85-2496(+)